MSSAMAMIRRRSGLPIIDDRGKTWTASGTAGITTAISKFGAGCLDISSTSGDSIYTGSGLGDFAFPSNSAFCFDFWLRVPSLNAGVIFTGEASGAIGLKMNASGALIPLEFGVGDFYTTSNAIVANTWHHVALTRNSSNVSNVWVDGSSVGSGTMSSSFVTPGTFSIGGYFIGTAENASCFIDDFRVDKGDPRYTSAFTAPTSEATASAFTVSLLRFNG